MKPSAWIEAEALRVCEKHDLSAVDSTIWAILAFLDAAHGEASPPDNRTWDLQYAGKPRSETEHKTPSNSENCDHGRGWLVDCEECGRRAPPWEAPLSNIAVRVRIEMLEHAVFGLANAALPVEARTEAPQQADQLETTSRGFGIYGRIPTHAGGSVRVQQSSMVASEPHVWLFLDGESCCEHMGKHMKPDPQLSLSQATALRDALERFIRDNSLDPEAPKPNDTGVIRAAEGVVLEPGDYEVVEVELPAEAPPVGARFTLGTANEPKGPRYPHWYVVVRGKWTMVTAVRRVEPERYKPKVGDTVRVIAPAGARYLGKTGTVLSLEHGVELRIHGEEPKAGEVNPAFPEHWVERVEPEQCERPIVVGSVWLEMARDLRSTVLELGELPLGSAVRVERLIDGRPSKMWFGLSVFRRLFTWVSDPKSAVVESDEVAKRWAGLDQGDHPIVVNSIWQKTSEDQARVTEVRAYDVDYLYIGPSVRGGGTMSKWEFVQRFTWVSDPAPKADECSRCGRTNCPATYRHTDENAYRKCDQAVAQNLEEERDAAVERVKELEAQLENVKAVPAEGIAQRDKLFAEIYGQSVEETVKQRDEARAQLAAAEERQLNTDAGMSTLRNQHEELKAENAGLKTAKALLTQGCEQALQALQPAKREERDAAISKLRCLLGHGAAPSPVDGGS